MNNCLECGEPMTAIRWWQKRYCSAKCKQRAYRRRKMRESARVKSKKST